MVKGKTCSSLIFIHMIGIDTAICLFVHLTQWLWMNQLKVLDRDTRRTTPKIHNTRRKRIILCLSLVEKYKVLIVRDILTTLQPNRCIQMGAEIESSCSTYFFHNWSNLFLDRLILWDWSPVQRTIASLCKSWYHDLHFPRVRSLYWSISNDTEFCADILAHFFIDFAVGIDIVGIVTLVVQIIFFGVAIGTQLSDEMSTAKESREIQILSNDTISWSYDMIR